MPRSDSRARRWGGTLLRLFAACNHWQHPGSSTTLDSLYAQGSRTDASLPS